MDKHDKIASWFIRFMGYGQTFGSAMKYMALGIAVGIVVMCLLMKLQHL